MSIYETDRQCFYDAATVGAVIAATEPDVSRVVSAMRTVLDDVPCMIHVSRPAHLGQTGTVYIYPDGEQTGRYVGRSFVTVR